MKRLASSLLALCLFVTEANAYWQSRSQSSVGAACSPFSYPAGQLYQSLDFADTWTAINGTLTTNATLSPACTTTGAIFTENTTNSTHDFQKTVALVTTATPHVFTIFLAQNAGSPSARNAVLQLFGTPAFTNQAYAQINLTTCTSPFSQAIGAWSAISTLTALQAGNGYCKVTINITTTIEANIQFTITMTDGTFTPPNLGDGSSIKAWGLDWR